MRSAKSPLRPRNGQVSTADRELALAEQKKKERTEVGPCHVTSHLFSSNYQSKQHAKLGGCMEF